jgi:hypothetical protein
VPGGGWSSSPSPQTRIVSTVVVDEPTKGVWVIYREDEAGALVIHGDSHGGTHDKVCATDDGGGVVAGLESPASHVEADQRRGTAGFDGHVWILVSALVIQRVR